MSMTEYVGSPVSKLLESEPFKTWPVERSIDDDLDERVVEYVFDGHGLELHCDGDGNIHTIFLFSEDYGGFDVSLFEIPFSLKRDQVREHFGSPSKSGEALSDPDLGVYGAWDRFSRPGLAVHIEYRPDADAISKITLMRSDVVP